ncbi:MerR family transcriptional regulator [Pseudonocardia spinosispora]|uniref:helix-turn-helix domain-containing protein n=1 Tax=Pseudonocardia spinosispora TaxID=103441 RepID=UPI00041A63E9|nr:MerR family transcriptional regulator [Pseudonocardia spinosispora]
MADNTLIPIGELARLTGLTVKTIRFWSDEGLVTPADRTPSGYRLYAPDAVLRLGLVRTLRELGIDLPTVRRVVRGEVTIAEVADTHAAALDVRIRALTLHRAVLRTVAERGTATPEEIQLMTRLAQLSAAERRTLITEFIEDTFAGLDLGPDFRPMMHAAMPDLPAEPTQAQVAAWVELAELVQDGDFRASLRRTAIDQAASIAEVGAPDADSHRALAALLRERTSAVTEAGIQPGSAEAQPVVDELAAAYARHSRRTDGPEFRAWLLERLVNSNDHRYERYWRLLSTINSWPTTPTAMPAADWLIAALRARA